MNHSTLPTKNPSTNITKIVPQIFFFFNDTATPEIYHLSLHDALTPCLTGGSFVLRPQPPRRPPGHAAANRRDVDRSEEHTSELQSRQYLVCRLLLEKKKTKGLYHA